MYFEATFDDEGVYPIRMRISAPARYEKDYDQDAEIRVEVADDGPVERVTDLIAESAGIRDDIDEMDESALRTALMNFAFHARTLADDVYPAATELLSATTAFGGRRSGRDYYAALLRDDLAALYTIRTAFRRTRQSGPVPSRRSSRRRRDGVPVGARRPR